MMKSRKITLALLLSTSIAVATEAVTARAAEPVSVADIKKVIGFLDANMDGELTPFEVFDQLLAIQAETGQTSLSFAALHKVRSEIEEANSQDAREALDALDHNQNGKVSLREAEEFLGDFARNLDENNNGRIDKSELENLNFADAISVSTSEIADEVAFIFRELDHNKDGFVEPRETDEWASFVDKDINRDQKLSKQELRETLTIDSSLATFRVEGDAAFMSGTINADTPAKVLELAFTYPDVRTIVMLRVPGSIDDEANLRAAQYIRWLGFDTKLTSESMVASGGTDFFLAGNKRTLASGAFVGVHSWGGPGFEGKDVPVDDPQHQLYLEYYEEIGIAAEFYWFTLRAAPAEDIHWMTEGELTKYDFPHN